MGPTEPMGPAIECARPDEDESAPGDEVEVTGCSVASYFPKTGLIPEVGEDVLLARDGEWMAAGPALA